MADGNFEDGRNLLSVKGLSVEFQNESGPFLAIDDISFDVKRGKTLTLVGESGSGKSVTASALMRLTDFAGGRITSGEIRYQAKDRPAVDLATASERDMRAIRGRKIAMIFQEPMTSLNPVLTVGDQIAETLIRHESVNAAEARHRACELLQRVRLPDAQALLARYPHQLSGGMRQRVMIAMALACKPDLLIADEPTTALDVTIQAQILAILRDLQQETGTALLFITHDMGVVAEIADDVIVMHRGRMIEQAPVQDLFERPVQPYTRALLSAVPRLGSLAGTSLPRRLPVPTMQDALSAASVEGHDHDTADYSRPLLEVDQLTTRFDVRRTLFGRVTHRVHAVEEVSFNVYPGETLALVGESGSGKSTIGRALQQLIHATSGKITFDRQDLAAMSPVERRAIRRRVQYIFQDPFASLDPRQTVGFSISEPIRVHGLLNGRRQIEHRVQELLKQVGLLPDHARRYPHEFSGGQRQRICIARALAAKPDLIIADECVSALDVSIQAQIVNLMMDLQEKHRLAFLFITHDMAIVERIAHRVAVMRAGQIVEIGPRRSVLESPQHPYTRQLLAAVPVPDPAHRRPSVVIEGEMPSPLRRVGDEPPIHRLAEFGPQHWVSEFAEA